MGSQGPKSTKPKKTPNQATQPISRSSSSLSSHLAMVELKQRILNSLSKLSDRDTHQIAIEELEQIIQSLSNDAVPMLLNSLFDASSSDPKPAVKKESLRLLGVLSASHPDSTATHLVKIVAHVAKRLRDNDPGVRDACRDTVGSLSGIYIKGEGENGVVSLFVKPLFEAMGENNKGVQVGAAMCLGRVVECAKSTPISAFQKLCPRLCKYLNSPNFMAKSALLSVVASLSQAGAIAPQSLEPLLQSIHECLAGADWATRKAAADTLTALALHSSDLIKDGAAATLSVLEASRFDKVPSEDHLSHLHFL
ncbi:phosphatidylinositol kinase- protein kinase tor1 [Ancistrocladus abbreviatus]